MKKMNAVKMAALLSAAALFLASCEKNGSSEGEVIGTEGMYVISANVDEANVLLQAESLQSGSLTTSGSGLETDTGTAWYFYKDSYLYRLQYNQGNAGVTTSYILDSEGYLQQRSRTYNISRFTTYGTVGENIVTVSAGDTDILDADGNAAQGLLFNYLDVRNQTNSTRSIGCEDYLGNGEYVTFSGLLEHDGKIYTSVVPMGMSKYGVAYGGGSRVTYPELVAQESGGSGSGAYEAGEIPVTQFPDSAYVAVFDGDDFSNPTIIRTGRIGFASGRFKSQYYQTIWAADDGDVYVFSPGYGRNHSGAYRKTGELPSGVMRIRSGSNEFDSGYYYNIEELSGGYAMYRCWHIDSDWFLLQMYTGGTAAQDAIGGIGGGTNAIAVFRGSTGQFSYVTGLPAQDQISSFGTFPFVEDGVIYVTVVTSDGSQPAVYMVDPTTATAVKGITVECDAISAIGRLQPQA